MWTIKIFSTKEKQLLWIEKNKSKFQYTEVFINNTHALEVKKLRRLY